MYHNKPRIEILIMVILMSLIISCNAFWWRSTTEATPVIKQIPVGYFRTYTYHQPLTLPGSYYSPFMYDRFAGWSQYSSNKHSPILGSKYDTTTSAPSTTPSTTTTTTTTTTQAPTQQPVQQHHYHYQSPPATSNFISASSSGSAGGHSYVSSAQVPAPQHLSSGPIRAHSWPASNYPNYQYYYPNGGNLNQQQYQQQPYSQPMGQSVRFVPCMCPVTVAISSDFPESRSTSNDDDMNLPETDERANNIGSSSEIIVNTAKEESSPDNTILVN